MRRPDGSPIGHLLVATRVRVDTIVRLSGRPKTEPWWGRMRSHRSDDPSSDPNGRFGVLYAGDSLQTAFAESVVHESSIFTTRGYLVSAAELSRRQKVYFRHPTKLSLRLADLTDDALKALGLNNDLSAGDDYEVPQLWARAVFEAEKKWDGIRYVSRQHNRHFAYAIFDRSGLVVSRFEPMTAEEERELKRRFHVITESADDL